MRRALTLVAILSPMVWAQTFTGTLQLTPMSPQVVLVQNRSAGNTGTFTVAAGSVTFTIESATATVAVQAPATVTGAETGFNYNLNPSAVFTLRNDLTGFKSGQVQLADACLWFSGTDNSPTACTVRQMHEILQIITPGATFNQPGVELIATIQLDTGSATAVYEVHYQWAITATPSIYTIDVLQETTYNPTFNDEKTVPLIADKPTLAQVWATSPVAVKNVTALLHGYRGTSTAELPGSPLSPMKGPAPIRASVPLPKSVNRLDFAKALNFLLPPEWIHAGDLTLKAELQLPAGVQFEPTQTSTTQTLKFVAGAASLTIAYIPFCYQKIPFVSEPDCPREVVSTYDRVIKKLYPIDPAKVHYFQLITPLVKSPWRPQSYLGIFFFEDSRFKSWLQDIFLFSYYHGTIFDQLAGWLPDTVARGTTLGSSDPSFFPHSGLGQVFEGFQIDPFTNPDQNAETMAHEIGHNLGLHHTNFQQDCKDIDPLTRWPYGNPSSQSTGFDFVSQTFILPALGDLMSYCDPQGISPFDVRELLQHRLLQPGAGQTQSARPRPEKFGIRAAGTGEQVIISGWAQRDGSEGPPSTPLQNCGSSGAPFHFFIFDLLMLRGKDVMAEPLMKRRGLIEKHVLPKLADPIRYSPVLEGSLKDLIHSVKAQGLEGLVAKRRDSKYESGLRSGAWQKMRVNQGQELVIAGYTPSAKNFDALVIGYYEDGKLIYAARTRNGFMPASRVELFKKLKPLEITECPFANLPEKKAGRWGAGLTATKMAECRWLKPVLVGQFEFVEWTGENHLRHTKFMGLRDDKKATDVRREEPA